MTWRAQGVKEVTLLGQNVNAWRGTIDGQPADFAELLHYVCELDVERVRYTTSHPRDFTQRLIDAHATLDKLAPHVHLPVQSGSDRVLAAMKRGYTALEYRSIVRRLRQARPRISLSSDFIVGFPGETEADFAATQKLAADAGFDASFSFLYSPRPGTPAAGLADDASAGREVRPAAAPPAATRRAGERDQRGHGRHGRAGPGRRPVEEKPGRARRPHRQQPRGELSGQRRAPSLHMWTCASPPPVPIRCEASQSESVQAGRSQARSGRQHSASRGCAARSTRTCGRSSPRST